MRNIIISKPALRIAHFLYDVINFEFSKKTRACLIQVANKFYYFGINHCPHEYVRIDIHGSMWEQCSKCGKMVFTKEDRI